MNGLAKEVNGNSHAGNILAKEPRTIDENETDELEQNAIEINLDTDSSTNIPIPARLHNGFLNSADGSPQEENDITSFVRNPEKQVSTLESYVTYEIKSRTTRADYPGPEFTIRRRYADFEWLKRKLELAFPAAIIPPLPEKFVLRGVLERFENDFITQRMAGLERFLYRICSDLELKNSEYLKSFIILKPFDFNALRRSDTKIIQKITENLKTATISQPTNIPTRWETEGCFADRMNDRMTRIERITERLHSELCEYQNEMESLVPEFRDWSKDEDEGSELTSALSSMSFATNQTAKAIDGLHQTYKTQVFPVIKEMNLYNDSVNATLQRRSTLQFNAEKLAEELSMKRADLERTKLKTNFSLSQYFASDPARHRQERIATLEFEITHLDKGSKELNDELVALESDISVNIQQYHSMRVKEMASALRSMAKANAHFYDISASAWSQATSDGFRQEYEDS